MVLSVLLAAKNVILNMKVKFVCPLCTQTWCIIMLIETLSAILAVILFCNFEREKLKIELGMGQMWKMTTLYCFMTNAVLTIIAVMLSIYHAYTVCIYAYKWLWYVFYVCMYVCMYVSCNSFLSAHFIMWKRITDYYYYSRQFIFCVINYG